MKRVKTVIAASVLCLLLGMEALAATPSDITTNTEPTSSVPDEENTDTENTEDGQDVQPQPPETTDEVKVELPDMRKDITGNRCRLFIDNASFKSGDETLTFSTNPLMEVAIFGVSSERTFPQEEAKKILNTDKNCKVTVWDLKLYYLNIDGEHPIYVPKDKPLTGVTISGKGDFLYGSDALVYLPADGSSYQECTITSATPMLHVVLPEITIPVNGTAPSLVTISVDESSSSTETTDPNTESGSDNGSGSSHSGRPAVYSQGETVGDLRVDKTGAAARVIKANGEESEVIVHPYLVPGTRTLTQAQAQRMLGTNFACSIYSLDLSIVDASGDYSQVTLKEGVVPVTFFIPDVTPESKVALRHWINGGSTYEDLPVEVGNGTVKAEFTSFSPVVIVVEQPGVTAAVENGPVSPKTGENSIIYAVEAVALLSLLGLFACRKKRQA